MSLPSATVGGHYKKRNTEQFGGDCGQQLDLEELCSVTYDPLGKFDEVS